MNLERQGEPDKKASSQGIPLSSGVAGGDAWREVMRGAL